VGVDGGVEGGGSVGVEGGGSVGVEGGGNVGVTGGCVGEVIEPSAPRGTVSGLPLPSITCGDQKRTPPKLGSVDPFEIHLLSDPGISIYTASFNKRVPFCREIAILKKPF